MKERGDEDKKKKRKDDKRRNREIALDGGSLHVARGHQSNEEATEVHAAVTQQLQNTPGAVAHFTSDAMEERLSLLQKDDKDPNLSTLNDKQKHAYEKRKRRGGNHATQARLQALETRRMEAAVHAAQAAALLQTAQTGLIEVENDMEKTLA